jgi:septal ring factor EnvC (AmiA/AmiB activator)
MVRRRAAARHILRRDVSELALLEEELADTESAQDRLRGERVQVELIEPPAPHSLARPVPGRVRGRCGTYEHDSGADLSRRGVEMITRPGREVRAVAEGTVRFVGEVEGLGQTIIIDHGDLVSVLARLRPVTIAAGTDVTRGQIIAEAEGRRVYLEIRLPLGPGGHPIDPAPLLERR